MRRTYLSCLVCLALILFSQMAFAATPQQGCPMTVAAIARAVAPVTEVPEPPAATLPNGLMPDPIFTAVIGDCCPGNKVANCAAPPAGWHVRCDRPQCETGELSCLYWH